MLNEGLSIMAVGVGMVMFFLIVLWFAITIMGKVVGWLNKIFPEQVEAVKTVATKAKSDVEAAIAIAAAKLRR